MSKLKVRVLSPVAELYDGEADSLHLATETGEMGVLPGHATLIGLIDFCVLKVQNGEKIEEYFVRNGNLMIEEDGETVRVLGHSIEQKSNMSIKSLEDYMNFILDRLSDTSRLSKYQIAFLEDQKSGVEKSFAIMRDL